MSKLFAEFRRRNLFRVAALYMAGAWIVIQLGIAFETSLELPGWFDRLLTTLVIVAFPFALLCAWQFEITSTGVRRSKPLPDDAKPPKLGLTLPEFLFAGMCVVFMGLIGWRVIGAEGLRNDAVIADAPVVLELVDAPARKQSATSVIVLPFENLLGDPSLDYLAVGLSASVRDTLAQNKAIRVTARSSSNAVAREGLSNEQIAERLGVSKVVEGRLERPLASPDADPDAIIVVSLSDALTSFTRWAESESIEGQNMLALRDRFVDKITTSLSDDIQLANAGMAGTDRPGAPTVPEAYKAYLQADTALSQEATFESVERARGHLERAARLDPGYSKAQSSLAEVYLLLGSASPDTDTARAFLDKSVAAAERAVALAPNDPESLSTLGTVLMTGRLDIPAAALPFEAMSALPLTSPSAIMRQAVFLSATGQHEDAVSAARQAYELDPLDAAAAETLAFALYAAREFEESARYFREALIHNPDRYSTRARLGLALIRIGETKSGIEACEAEANLMEAMPCLAAAAVVQDRPADAQAALDRVTELYGDAGAYQQVQILAEMGRREEALETLRLAERLKDTGLTLAGFDPALDSLRDDEYFQGLLERLGLAP